jgi:hypothetical protein
VSFRGRPLEQSASGRDVEIDRPANPQLLSDWEANSDLLEQKAFGLREIGLGLKAPNGRLAGCQDPLSVSEDSVVVTAARDVGSKPPV